MQNLPEKAQMNQRIANTKKIKDRYIAEHYYQTGSDTSLLFEKDTRIASLKQFDYKIHRLDTRQKNEVKTKKDQKKRRLLWLKETENEVYIDI